MTTATTSRQAEVLEFQDQFWDAIKSGDKDALTRLTADDFTFVMNRSISNFDRTAFVEMMTKSGFKMHSYEIDSESVTFREFAPNVAFVAYKAREDFELEGKREDVDSYYSATWLKSGDTWQCAVATESRE
jgi:ketosteroid isomerase-like protein